MVMKFLTAQANVDLTKKKRLATLLVVDLFIEATALYA